MCILCTLCLTSLSVWRRSSIPVLLIHESSSSKKSDLLHADLITFLNSLNPLKRTPHSKMTVAENVETDMPRLPSTLSESSESAILREPSFKTAVDDGHNFFSTGSGMYSTDARFHQSSQAKSVLMYDSTQSAQEASNGLSGSSKADRENQVLVQARRGQVQANPDSGDISAMNSPSSEESYTLPSLSSSTKVEPPTSTTISSGKPARPPDPQLESLEDRMARIASELRSAQEQIRQYRRRAAAEKPRHAMAVPESRQGGLSAEPAGKDQADAAAMAARIERAILYFTNGPRTPAPADDSVTRARRPPLRHNPLWPAASNATWPYGQRRRRYWLNRPDPKRSFLEGKGVVVSAWPGVEERPRRHWWGYDGWDHYNASAARPAFNYSRARHPAWAADNHAMRSQPEFWDPEGPANLGLVSGRLPHLFGDSWSPGRYTAVRGVAPGTPS